MTKTLQGRLADVPRAHTCSNERCKEKAASISSSADASRAADVKLPASPTLASSRAGGAPARPSTLPPSCTNGPRTACKAPRLQLHSRAGQEDRRFPLLLFAPVLRERPARGGRPVPSPIRAAQEERSPPFVFTLREYPTLISPALRVPQGASSSSSTLQCRGRGRRSAGSSARDAGMGSMRTGLGNERAADVGLAGAGSSPAGQARLWRVAGQEWRVVRGTDSSSLLLAAVGHTAGFCGTGEPRGWVPSHPISEGVFYRRIDGRGSHQKLAAHRRAVVLGPPSESKSLAASGLGASVPCALVRGASWVALARKRVRLQVCPGHAAMRLWALAFGLFLWCHSSNKRLHLHLHLPPMGSQKNSKRKAPSTGKRKTKKAVSPQLAAAPPPRPKPQPRVKLNISQPKAVDVRPEEASAETQEDQAAAVLVAMGNHRQVQSGRAEFESAMDRVFIATVPGVHEKDLVQDSDGEQRSKHSDSDDSDSDSGSSSDEDSDDNHHLSMITYLSQQNLPISSPAQEARARKVNKFDIPFEVPCNGAVRDLEGVTSRTSFDKFLDKLAAAMSTRKSLLSGIAYIPSYKPKNPKPIPKLLDGQKAWTRLIEDVDSHIQSKTKPKGKAVIKPFHIQIVDTSGGDPKTSAGGGGKKGKKDKDPEPAIKETKEHQLYRQLEQKYQCAEHHKACVVLSSGDHYHLTAADLSKWAYMAANEAQVIMCQQSNHTATLNTTPDELNILDASKKQHKAKKALAQTATSESEPPQWAQNLMGIAMGGMMMRNNFPAPYETPRPAPATRPQPVAGSSRQAALFSPAGNAGPSHEPSSGTKRAAAVHAPSILAWLSSLDSDATRGRHNVFYAQYTQSFENNGILDLTDIEDLSATEISHLTTAPIGIANRITKYAKDDIAKLLNEASKRARHY
ncbi:hypothetical protein DFH09DRAFT_1291665 [Mycena vulgaris]|nr:hypothetical protein DFH09DRAFT_1291665 [Mycena vulgaris]